MPSRRSSRLRTRLRVGTGLLDTENPPCGGEAPSVPLEDRPNPVRGW
jgi:hypothetical protein